jgi:uncharacterized membrane protein (DUF106 family)
MKKSTRSQIIMVIIAIAAIAMLTISIKYCAKELTKEEVVEELGKEVKEIKDAFNKGYEDK